MLKLVLLIFVGLGSSSALAHAFLDHALPAVGSTVQDSPHEIRLWFTQRLEPAFSKARVLDKTG
jgi:methionine-rich copper-binding protein CopC